MQIVAEQGLTTLSTRLAARRAGVSDGLMYRFFESKEALLYACFESVHKDIAALFTDLPQQLSEAAVTDMTPAEQVQMIRKIWETYFRFLIQNDYRTLFYFEYRNSSYIKKIREKDGEARTTYFKGFVEALEIAEKYYHIYDKISTEILWSYILDTSGLFAGRIIRGEIPNTEESIEQIWGLMSKGIIGLFMANPS